MVEKKPDLPNRWEVFWIFGGFETNFSKDNMVEFKHWMYDKFLHCWYFIVYYLTEGFSWDQSPSATGSDTSARCRTSSWSVPEKAPSTGSGTAERVPGILTSETGKNDVIFMSCQESWMLDQAAETTVQITVQTISNDFFFLSALWKWSLTLTN